MRQQLQSKIDEGDPQGVLSFLAEHFEARTVTLHASDAGQGLLRHVASIGLPPHVVELTAVIPFGKGMAGICYERGEPVTVCNLQTDDSGVVRPGAKDTRVAGALVVPLKRATTVVGTLGIGKSEDHEYTEAEIEEAQNIAALLLPLLESR